MEIKNRYSLVVSILVVTLVIASNICFAATEKIDFTENLSGKSGRTTLTAYSDGYYDHSLGYHDTNYYTAHDASTAQYLDWSGEDQMEFGQKDNGYPGYTNWYIHRYYAYFDTSDLPDNAVISSVQFSFWNCHSYLSGPRPILMAFYDPSSIYPHQPLQMGDFDLDHYSDTGAGSFTINLPAGEYKTWTWNSGAYNKINKIGWTKIMFTTQGDWQSNQNSVQDYSQMYSGESPNPPYLTIQYTTAPPGDPSNLNAYNPTSSTIDLSWTKGTNSDKTMIRRKTGSYPTSPTDGTQAYFSTGTTTTDTGLNPSTTYYYRAWAYDSNSGQYSTGYSSDYETTTSAPPPGDPSNLNAYNPTSSTIDLSWTKGTNSDKTMIRRKTGSYPTSPTDGTQAYFSTGTTTTDTGLNPSTTYYYRAWAYDSNTGQYSTGYSQDYETTTSGPSGDEWTVMVYLDGDNNLEGYGIDDFLEMAEAGSTDDVNIIVQFDRRDGFDTRYDDWTTTKRYQVEHNMVPNNANALADIGEANMGDPQTLINFANWAITNYPANRYCLILWDHGGGWGRNEGNEITKDVCWDDTNGGDALTMPELRGALATVTSNGNNPINLLGFDACLMQMIEVGYEVKSYCNFMTGSEESEPGFGWRYDNTLTILIGTPTLSPQALGAQFVSDYASSGGYTLSTINLGLLDSLRSDVSDLGVALQDDNFKDEIGNAIDNVESYAYPQYVDLYHFAQLLMQYINDNTVDDLAQSVMNELDNVVTSENHGSGYPNSHGLSIYVPPSWYDEGYEDLLFAQDSQWDEFLSWYQGTTGNNAPVKPEPPSGQTSGEPDVEYTYTAVTTDPDGDIISYIFSWGDGTTSQTNFVQSGQEGSASHSWNEKGTYEIRVKAVDQYGAESDWSDPLPVSMPMNLPNSQSSQQSQNRPINQQSNQLPQNLLLILLRHQMTNI